MDAELKALVQKFQQLQKKDVVHCVNERNIIEIVNVIHKKQHLVNILYTSDGKEFLTWDQLRREIVNEVFANSGKINIVDLPAALNVDMSAIEKAIDGVLEENQGTVTLYMGELMTREYLDSLVLEAQEQLREGGSLLVSEFAKSHQLSSVFLGDLFRKAIAEGTLHAEFQDVALYTKQYVHAQRMMLRSALLAHSSPVTILELAARHGLSNALLPAMLQQLAPELPGAVEGGASGQYIPHVYSRRRFQQVHNIYASNGYVAYATLSSEAIGNPKRYMEQHFNPPVASSGSPVVGKAAGGGKRGASRKGTAPLTSSQGVSSVKMSDDYPLAGHSLVHCFLADRSLANLVLHLDGLATGESRCVDLADHLPNCVDFEADGDIIIRRLGEMFPAVNDCVVVGHSILILSGPLLDSLKSSILSIISDELRSVKANASDTVASSTATKKSGKGGKSDESSSEKVRYDPCHSRKILLLVSKATGLPLETKQAELEELLGTWEGALCSLQNEVAAAHAQHAHAESKRARAEHQKQCATEWTELCIVRKGADWAAKELLDGNDSASLQRSIIQNRCNRLACDIIIDEAANTSAEVSEKVSLCNGNARQMMQCFEKKKQAVFATLMETLQGKSVGDFVDCLETMSSNGEVTLSCFHALNKKSEREAAAAMRARLLADVEGASFDANPQTCANLFASCCTAVLAAKLRVVLPNIPGKTINGVCSVIAAKRLLEERLLLALQDSKEAVVRVIAEGKCDDAVAAALNSFRRELVGALSGGTDPVDDCSS